jgi:hypothetical protein
MAIKFHYYIFLINRFFLQEGIRGWWLQMFFSTFFFGGWSKNPKKK